MKASFLKRLWAFIIDSFILSIVFSLIAFDFKDNSSEINNELNNILELYEAGNITIDQYNDKLSLLNFELQKNSLLSNILEVVLYVGYFVIFCYLNKGQTLGKKICNIRIVRNDENNPGVMNMIIRSLFVYGISTLFYSVIFVNILDSMIFTYGYVIVSYIEFFFMIISFFMMIYKKDGRGIHDILAKTKVIEEVK